jgi:subtilase family serine protease
MSKVISPKNIIRFISPLAVTLISLQAQAALKLPDGWQAHNPIHVRVNPQHSTVPSGFTPAQIKKAYGFPAQFQGAGQVIAIVDAFDDPTVEADLAIFSNQFGLPACTTANGCFTKLFASGTAPAVDPGWAQEISLDVQWAHAIAPQAKILLIESADNGDSIFDAVTFAIKQKPSVISLSWGGAEFSGEKAWDPIFQSSPVPIVAAAGDAGDEIIYPAASPYVVSAGGTELTLDANGNFLSEQAWFGGGGLSAYETEPNYQIIFPLPQNPNRARGVPDVAYNASSFPGYSVYYSPNGWLNVGGTSASTPQWAALIAIMKLAKNGNFGAFNQSIYSVARTPSLFRDITTGFNGSCSYYCAARSGYDYITGNGSPQAANLINRFM